MIYLDNASTTYIYPECIDIIKDILNNNWGNPSNIYSFGQNSSEIICQSREIIAKTINCNPNEVFFTSGSSEGNAWGMKQGEVVFASPYEHHSITGNPNTTIIDDEDFLNKTNSINDKSVYAHMLVSNETGEIFDVNPLFDKAHELGMFVLCDMTQAFGNIEIDVNRINCDMAVFSAHKFHGPKGIGFVYIKKDKIQDIKPLIYGTQQIELRGGTENVAYISAMATAAQRTINEMTLKFIKSRQFNEIILSELNKSNIDFIINRGRNYIESTLNISLKNIESEILQAILSDNDVFVGVGSGCNNSLFELSKTLQKMNIPEEYIHGPIRFSYSLNNTPEDVENAIKLLIETYKEITNA